MSNKVFLCFDHGEKRIGVAVGQSLTSTATALGTIQCRSGKPDWEKIKTLIEQWRPDELVIGKPLTMQGDRQPATDAAERFARQLQGRFVLPFHLADERLSSHEAKQRLKSSYDVDPLAAQLILESWLAEEALKETGAALREQ